MTTWTLITTAGTFTGFADLADLNARVTNNGDGTFAVNNPIGSWSFSYQIDCGNGIVDTAIVTGFGISADAINDVNALSTGDLTTNDVACNTGVTSYQLSTTPNLVNLDSATVSSAGVYSAVITTLTTAWSFDYDILCDGVVIDTATVSGGPITVSGTVDNFSGTPSNPVSGGVATNDDASCSPEGTRGFALVVGSPSANLTVTSFDASTGAFVANVGAGAVAGVDETFTYNITCTVNGVTQVVTGPILVTIDISNNPSITANDDGTINVLGSATGLTYDVTGLVSGNTPCGTPTYAIVTDGSAGATINATTGVITYDANVGSFTIVYSATCTDGSTTDSGTLTFNGIEAVDDTAVNTIAGTSVAVDTTTNDTLCA